MTTVKRNTRTSDAIARALEGPDALDAAGIDPFDVGEMRSSAVGDDDLTVESLSIQLSQIEVDDDFNARKTYRDITKLAASIKAQGLLQPLVVRRLKTKPDELNRFALVAGFRRKRALDLIAQEGKTDSEKDPFIDVRIMVYDGRDDAMLGNLAADSATDPLRTYDIASRLYYLKKKWGSTHAKLAEIAGKSTPEISVLIGCMEDLAPEVQKVWASSTDPGNELPLSRLNTWRKHPVAEQKRLLHAFVSNDPKPVVAAGSEKEGEDRRIDGKRPVLRILRAELVKVVEKLDAKPAPTATERARLEGMQKTLRYAMGEISRLW